jgi:hypothetical protein
VQKGFSVIIEGNDVIGYLSTRRGLDEGTSECSRLWFTRLGKQGLCLYVLNSWQSKSLENVELYLLYVLWHCKPDVIYKLLCMASQDAKCVLTQFSTDIQSYCLLFILFYFILFIYFFFLCNKYEMVVFIVFDENSGCGRVCVCYKRCVCVCVKEVFQMCIKVVCVHVHKCVCLCECVCVFVQCNWVCGSTFWPEESILNLHLWDMKTYE